MLNININEEKPLIFEIQLSGINPDALTGYLRLEIESIEYGFPVKFDSEKISVVLPPLKNIIHKELKEGEVLKGRLEANGNGHFLNPWSGEFKVISPIKMEAKIYDESNETLIEAPKVNVSKIVSERKETYRKLKENITQKETPAPKKKEVEIKLLNNVTKEDIFKFMNHMGTKNKSVQKVIYEQCEVQVGSDNPKNILKEVYRVLKKND